MARSATPRRQTSRRAAPLDRPARRYVSPDHSMAPPAGTSSAANGPELPAAPDYPLDQETIVGLTPTAFWVLLPATERERLGLRLSQLVLKAVRPPIPTSQENR